MKRDQITVAQIKVTKDIKPIKEAKIKYSVCGIAGTTIKEAVENYHKEESNDFFHDNNLYLYNIQGHKIIDVSLDSLPHCCGISEIGGLILPKTGTKYRAIIPEITEFLDSIITTEGNGHTYMINTNGKDVSVLFEKALEKSQYFILVKTFVNAGSKNTIKTWISNNK